MNLEFISIELFTGLLAGIIIGFIVAQLTLKAKPKSQTLSSSADFKLEKEVLTDKVKQLESKIKTLEKALELKG